MEVNNKCTASVVSYARAIVNYQQPGEDVYEPYEAWINGTVFPALNIPYKNWRNGNE